LSLGVEQGLAEDFVPGLVREGLLYGVNALHGRGESISQAICRIENA